MLDAKDFVYKAYQDSRTKQHAGFIEGTSGPLLLATHQQTGKKYIVKHTYRHNAANEYVACWLGHKLGVPTPEAYLLSGDGPFASKYAVAISFIDGFTTFDKKNPPENLRDDLTGQFALNALIATDDAIQLNAAGGHIYSYDFSESFYVCDEMLLKMFLFNDDMGIEMVKQRLAAFKTHLQLVDFDVPILAKEFGLDPDVQHAGMIATASRVLDISDKEIEEMSDELMDMYPVGYGVYYEECIRSIRDHVKALKDGAAE